MKLLLMFVLCLPLAAQTKLDKALALQRAQKAVTTMQAVCPLQLDATGKPQCAPEPKPEPKKEMK